jgi:hypothetical protein
MRSSSSIERSFAQRIASVLTPYLSEIEIILSRDFTVCFLLFFFPIVESLVTTVLIVLLGELSPPIRMRPVSEI